MTYSKKRSDVVLCLGLVTAQATVFWMTILTYILTNL